MASFPIGAVALTADLPAVRGPFAVAGAGTFALTFNTAALVGVLVVVFEYAQDGATFVPIARCDAASRSFDRQGLPQSSFHFTVTLGADGSGPVVAPAGATCRVRLTGSSAFASSGGSFDTL